MRKSTRKKEPVLMFPKNATKRRRTKHPKSILQEKNGICFLCSVLEGDTRQQSGLHKHHVFFGSANRRMSEEDGLYIYLCMRHHEIGPDAVHKDKGSRVMTQIYAQEVYEKTHTREEFVERYGRSYI